MNSWNFKIKFVLPVWPQPDTRSPIGLSDLVYKQAGYTFLLIFTSWTNSTKAMSLCLEAILYAADMSRFTSISWAALGSLTQQFWTIIKKPTLITYLWSTTPRRTLTIGLHPAQMLQCAAVSKNRGAIKEAPQLPQSILPRASSTPKTAYKFG